MNCCRTLNFLCGITLSILSTSTLADIAPAPADNNSNFHFSALFLQPGSNNLKYAVFVAGNQPYSQSWHNQIIDPGYSPAFEIGFNYGIPQSLYNASIDWLYLNTNDSSSKQASQSTDISTVQFVAPPYDVGPAVFAIKRANSTVNYNFNSVLLNVGKIYDYNSNLQMRLFGGLNLLRLTQTIKTVFSDLAGSPPVATQAYALPADPAFYFQTKNTSQYLGAGPDLGVNIQYKANNGLGVIGQFMGVLTAGSMNAKDNFTSASARLMALGNTTSRQEISVPSSTEVVPGFNSKLGLFFDHSWRNSLNLSIEAGYRFAYYANAISGVSPATLVQPGVNVTIPEFATGTMAINSTATTNSPFNFKGPYINFTVDLI